MKKRILLIALLLAVGLAGQSLGDTYYAEGDWVVQLGHGTEPGIDRDLKGIAKIDGYKLWTVGTKGAVLYTADGGWNWQEKSVITSQADYDFMDVCFAGTLNGWIVGYKNTGTDRYSGILLRTTDGGSTWRTEWSATYPFLSIKMIASGSYYYGYIGCGDGVVLKYNGTTWLPTQKRPSPNADSLSLWYHGLWVNPANSSQIIVSGDNSCLISRSSDGGGNWQICNDPANTVLFDRTYSFPAGTNTPLGTRLAIFKVSAADLNNLSVALSDGKVAYTANGGTTWQLTANSATFPASQWFYDVVGNQGVGSDGSINWGYHNYDDPSYNLRDIAGQWTVGDSCRIMRSHNAIIEGETYDLSVLSVNNQIYNELEVTWEQQPGVPSGVLLNFYTAPTIAGPWEYRDWAFTGGAGQGKTTFAVTRMGNTFVKMEWNKNIWVNYRTNYANYNVGPAGGLKEEYLRFPISLTATQLAGQHGKKIMLQWDYNNYRWNYIYRKVNGSTAYVLIDSVDGGTTYTDENVSIGKNYTYRVMYWDIMVGIPKAETDTTEVSITTFDTDKPPQVAQPTGYYDAVTKCINLRWPEEDPTLEPNFGGYWVCPEPVGVFASKPSSKYTVNHSAPIERTTWSYIVPDYLIGQTLQMHVTAMDRSCNIGSWSPYVQINTKAFTNSNTAMATAYNNGRHLLYDSNGKLHLTYTSADSVFYQNSIDDGYTWSGTWASGPAVYAEGTNPSSVIGIYGPDTVIAWKAETPSVGWVLKTAKHTGATWQNVETLMEAPGYWDQMHQASPPAMVVNSAGTHLVLEKIDSWNSASGYTWYWKLLYGFRPAGGTAFAWNTLDSTSGSGGDPQENPASPTICIDSKGGIHVAWDYEGEIYWKVYDPYTSAWKNKVNLSQSPEVVSDEPSLAFYGDIHVVWQEGNDIFHNKGNWGLALAKALYTPFSWEGSENVSNSPLTASLNPVFDGNYIAWSEATTDELYKACYANYADFAWQVEQDYSKNPTQPSVYPQIAYRQNADGNKMTTIWTEGTGPLYSLIARDSAGQVTAALSADVGGETPSIYTLERDGFITYSAKKSTGITVDYDSTALEYYLPTLNSEQKNTLKISLYQQYSDKADYIYQIWVDNVSLGTVKVPSGQMAVFEKDLPQPVSQDGEGVLKIVNLKKGAIVTCDKYELFAYDKATGRKTGNGGAQADMGEAKPMAYRYELMQNAPNPCSKQTTISYQLAKQGQVSLKIYNTLGQVVKTLVNESQNPGPYSVKWNGNDEAGRQAAAGIYFYRLVSGEFNSTKKMVALK